MMKNLITLLLGFMTINTMAQIIPAETFREHILMISENREILKKYKVEDEEGNSLFYVNVGKYGDYHQAEPIRNRTGEVYLWNQGAIFFYDVEFAIELLSVEENEDGMVFYKFDYHDGKKKYFIEVKFGNRYDKWELVDVAISRVKKAY
jgi:hypothetical protein